ncbi:MAG: hypothetical protein U9R32_02410, partial [Bacteroidota bacterium]|nr:hypothetical protein [Bacteroidota bacterium]
MIRKILFVFLLISLFSCNRDSYPFIGKEVRETIVLSGINNVELMKAIVKYTNRKDSLKLEMCFYLIKEMKNHSHKTYLLRDSLGQLVDYNISEFNSINEVIEHKNSVINKSGEVRFYRHYNGEDVYKITGVYIVNQVERAFASGYYNIYEDKIGCELV